MCGNKYKLSIVTFSLMLLLIMAGISWGQTSTPPKHQLGSRENPYYTTSEDHVTLRQYFEARLKAMDELVNTKFKEKEKAIDAALASMNTRLAGMNEFRDALKDQANSFVTRAELLAAVGFLAALMFGLLQFTKREKPDREKYYDH